MPESEKKKFYRFKKLITIYYLQPKRTPKIEKMERDSLFI
jgi:hypothetical protein